MARPNSGARLRQNAHGIWEIHWTEDGRSRRLSTRQTAQAAAQRVLAGWLDQLEAEQEPGADLTINDVLDTYERGHVDENKCVDVGRQRDIIRWLREGLGHLLVSEVTDMQIANYRKARNRGDIGRLKRDGTRMTGADSTVRRELTALRAALNYAVRYTDLTRDQVPFMDLPENAKPRDFWLTEKEASALLQTAERLSTEAGRMTRAHRFLVLGLATAARKGAILHLPWELVDLEAGLVRYDQLDGRRTKKRKVSVPLADWALPLVQRAYDERESELVMDWTGDIRKALEALCRKAASEHGNPRYLRLNPHALRHTAATHMARAGVPMWEIAGVLGDTMATVERVYGHHCPDHLRRAVNARQY